jgi:hypothetical protein
MMGPKQALRAAQVIPIGGGAGTLLPAPPAKPDVRLSRIRLSGQHLAPSWRLDRSVARTASRVQWSCFELTDEESGKTEYDKVHQRIIYPNPSEVRPHLQARGCCQLALQREVRECYRPRAGHQPRPALCLAKTLISAVTVWRPGQRRWASRGSRKRRVQESVEETSSAHCSQSICQAFKSGVAFFA